MQLLLSSEQLLKKYFDYKKRSKRLIVEEEK